MGSCVSLSLSRSPPASTELPELARQVPARVVDTDGSMATFEGPVTAREALALASGASSPCFLCSADELDFDAPAPALAAEEPLRRGQLYFVLPATTLRRPLSGQEMAALAVKAARALDVEMGLAATARVSSSLGPKQKKTARVAPLVALLSKESISSDQDVWKHQRYEYDGGRTVGKTRHGDVRGARGRADLQRLSAIAEGSE